MLKSIRRTVMKSAAATILGLWLCGGLAGSDEPGKKRDADSPVGSWKNANGVELKVTENRLFWSTSSVRPTTFDADYAILKDSIIVGYITNAEGGTSLQVDTPFSFRFRVDDNIL